MLIKTSSNIDKLILNLALKNKPLKQFDNLVVQFLEEFHAHLDILAKKTHLEDLIAFSFWLRPKNIKNLKLKYQDGSTRIGYGIAFHITPSNMPINFIYSYVFSLLAGNINIIRVPSKNYIQIDFLMEALSKVFKKKKYKKIKDMSHFINYDKTKKYTVDFSSVCDLRIVWGGDSTINEIRKIPIRSNSKEMVFSDKYSVSLINSDQVLKSSKLELIRLAKAFFNDGYLVDQNACSSPHLIFWIGKNKNSTLVKFWNEVEKFASTKYDLPQIGAIDKFNSLCNDLLSHEIKNNIERKNNYLHHLMLNKIPNDITTLRGRWGYFYEYKIEKIENLTKLVDKKFQTISYFGVNKGDIINSLIDHNCLGVDRVVPIGRAHAMDNIWDGYDIINSMSRIISV